METKLEIGRTYMVIYFDHFEEPDAEELTITELGYFLGENERYYFFASYKDSTGEYYNRTGIMKSCITSVAQLVLK